MNCNNNNDESTNLQVMYSYKLNQFANWRLLRIKVYSKHIFTKSTREVHKGLLNSSRSIVLAVDKKKNNDLKNNFIKVNFNKIVSPVNLKINWIYIKNNSYKTYKIRKSWFVEASKKLYNNTYSYFNNKKVSSTSAFNVLLERDLGVKIIEQVILNAIKPLLEGLWEWIEVSKSEYEAALKNKIKNFTKKFEQKFFIKNWILPVTYSALNFSFKSYQLSCSTLWTIKRWYGNMNWLINCKVSRVFNTFTQNQLKKTWRFYIQDDRLCNEMQKIMETWAWRLNNYYKGKNVTQKDNLYWLLYNIYLTQLDNFIININKEPSSKYQILNNMLITNNQQNSITTPSPFNIKIIYGWYFILNKTNKRIQSINFPSVSKYIRFGDNFLISINKYKHYPFFYKKINNFIKNDILLKLEKSILVNCNKNTTFFLNFLIHKITPSKRNKVTKTYFFNSIKYKKKILNRFTTTNTRLSKASIFAFKKNLIKAFRNVSNTNKFNKATPALKLSEKIFTKNDKQPYYNQLKWKCHFLKLFELNYSLLFKRYHKRIQNLALPEKSQLYIKLKEFKDEFIKNLSLLNTKNTSFKLQQYSINAPMHKLINNLIIKKIYYANKRKLVINKSFINFSDVEIISYYTKIMYSMLSYYKYVNNLSNVKSLLERLRKSCILILAYKHKKGFFWSYNIYSEDVKVIYNNETIALPSKKIIFSTNQRFLSRVINKKFSFDKQLTNIKKLPTVLNINNPVLMHVNFCLKKTKNLSAFKLLIYKKQLN